MELRCIQDYAEPTIFCFFFSSRAIVDCTCGRRRWLCALDIQTQRGAHGAEWEAEIYPADAWQSGDLLPIQSRPHPEPQHSHRRLTLTSIYGCDADNQS